MSFKNNPFHNSFLKFNKSSFFSKIPSDPRRGLAVAISFFPPLAEEKQQLESEQQRRKDTKYLHNDCC
jgi:hypothetical protein